MVCRRLPHLLRDMPVHIQREARRRVAEVCLHGLDVVAAFNGDHGVAVPQIVKVLSGKQLLRSMVSLRLAAKKRTDHASG